MMTRGERLDWLDAAKGLGIILVVIGHAWTKGQMRDTIYAFHMPLFFLLAGYTARPKPMAQYLSAQLRSMAIPYVAFLLTLAAIDPLIEHARGYLPMFRTWEAAGRALLLGGSELSGPLTILWFIPCLLVARIMQNALLLLWPDVRDWRWFVAMAAALWFGIWIGARTDFSPLGLLSVPVALVFLWLGAVWRVTPLQGCMAFLAAIAVFFWVLGEPVPPINMKAGDYGDPLFALPLAVLMSLALVWVAKAIPWRPLVILGQMSMVIMYCHVAVIHYGRPYFSTLTLAVLGVGIPVLVHILLARWRWSARIFLGK